MCKTNVRPRTRAVERHATATRRRRERKQCLLQLVSLHDEFQRQLATADRLAPRNLAAVIEDAANRFLDVADAVLAVADAEAAPDREARQRKKAR